VEASWGVQDKCSYLLYSIIVIPVNRVMLKRDDFVIIFRYTEVIPIKNILVFMLLCLLSCMFLSGCVSTKTREEAIPDDAIKMLPETDMYPPVVHNDEWEQPVPLEGPVNTAGAEDAPVITPDGTTFFFFFTPDVQIPAEKQILDGVTGIWWCTQDGDSWTEPERVVLSKTLSLDGSLCIEDNILWFCSVRTGNYREIDIYTAEEQNGKWTNVQNAGYTLNVEYGVGEMYTTADGTTMYYHSNREGGLGGVDLWSIEKREGEWQEPVHLGSTINTELDEGWPYVSSDGVELWFTRWSGLGYMGPALFRTVKLEDGNWSEPEEIISNFAGDPAVDDEGNIYFTHHFYSEDMEMIEADIYVAYKK